MCTKSPTSSDVAFRIQDFTTATPLERLARQISQTLLSWKDQGHFSDPDDSSITYLTNQICSQTSKQYFELTYINNKGNAFVTKYLCGHSLSFYEGKQTPLSRWFGVSKYLLLSPVNISEHPPLAYANGLLDSMTLGCQECAIYLPCFVLLSNTTRYHCIGQLIHPSPEQLSLIHYETDSEREPPTDSVTLKATTLSNGCGEQSNLRFRFFAHFCLKIGIPVHWEDDSPTAVRFYDGFQAGYRYVYYIDEFPLLRRPSFWLNCYAALPSTRSKRNNTIASFMCDPITQLHLVCAWKPKKLSSPLEIRSPLDAWDHNACSWSLRAVGSEDRLYADVLKMLTVSKASSSLLSLILGAYKISVSGPPQLEDASPLTTSETDLTFRYAQTAKTLTSLFTRHLTRAVASIIQISEEDAQHFANYIFSSIQEPGLSASDPHSNSFGFRLTVVLTQLTTHQSINLVWKAIMTRIRACWEQKRLIPNVTSDPPYLHAGLPAPFESPVIQKIKVLNCCIQQHHVVNQSREAKASLLLPVLPPMDSVTHSVVPARLLQHPEDEGLPFLTLVQYYTATRDSCAPLTFENFYSWVKTLPSIPPLLLSDLASSFGGSTTELHSHSPSKRDEAKTDQKLRRLWNAFSVQKRFARSNFTDFSSALFHHDVDGEMALHYLEHLTPLEIAVEGFHHLVSLIFACWGNHPEQHLRYMNELLYRYFCAVSKASNHEAFILGRGAFVDWDICRVALHHWNPPTQELEAPCHTTCLTDILNELQNAIEQFEITLMCKHSLEKKCETPLQDPTLLESLLKRINVNQECRITMKEDQKAIMQLFAVDSNIRPSSSPSLLSADSPLPLCPINAEYLFGYAPVNELPSYALPALTVAHRAYFSLMPHEFRVALWSQKRTAL